jgi:hypothetical protein
MVSAKAEVSNISFYEILNFIPVETTLVHFRRILVPKHIPDDAVLYMNSTSYLVISSFKFANRVKWALEL